MWLDVRGRDYAAFALVTIGIIGMVAHFWIREYGGMAWSGATVAAGILIVGWRVVTALGAAKLPVAIAAHIVLAFVNVALAATAGVLIGFDKVYHFLPGFVLTNLFAHAHLAAVGWASLMVVGVAYRLLPMVLPSDMPRGPRLWIGCVLLQAGVIGLFAALVTDSRLTSIFAVAIVGGFATFLSQLAWMIRRPRRRPPGVAIPDPAVLHAGAAMTSLVVACGLGTWLAVAQPSEAGLRVSMAYGVFGLVGFLAQMVVGMEGRLLPIFASYWESANRGYRGPVTLPHYMPSRWAQELVFVLWLFGVPALAIGPAFDAVPFVRAAAWALLAATLVDSANMVRILGHAFRKPVAEPSAVPRTGGKMRNKSHTRREIPRSGNPTGRSRRRPLAFREVLHLLPRQARPAKRGCVHGAM